MNNKVINVIRPIENSAEKEYLKEFFRFIGSFLSDWTVDEQLGNDWNRWLKPTNEDGCVDILINFFGKDPYRIDCKWRGIKRIYCYFSFEKKYGMVSDQPLETELMIRPANDKMLIRQTVLNGVIEKIWENESAVKESILKIVSVYTNNSQGDLFFYLQAKRALRFLTMGEVLNEPTAQITHVQYAPYITQAIEALWELYVKLEDAHDAYGRYTRLKAASNIREIASKMHPEDVRKLGQINCLGKAFRMPSQSEMIMGIKELIEAEPHFLSAYLCLAGQCRNMPDGDQGEESCYLKILQSIPNGRPEYAFIHYRIGYYFEKKHGNISKAIEYYQSAVTADPGYYQALFKLGYFAAKDGCFKEAELLLHRTIQSIFHGRSTEPDENGRYPNWLALSQKESQYAFKAYILLAKIAINSNREYSASDYIGKACMAATRFDEAGLVRHVSESHEIHRFWNYHHMSAPVEAVWKVLMPWSEGIIQDLYVRNIVRERLQRWK